MNIGGIFGKKKYNWGDPETPVDGLPIPGSGLPGTGQGMPSPEAMQQPKKPSFFGQGGIGRGIAGTIGDVLLQNAGAAPVYAPAMQGQRRQEFAEAQYEKKRQADYQDFMAKEAYKRQHPEQTAFAKDLSAAGIDPASEQGRQLYGQYVTNKATAPPIVQRNPDGTTTVYPSGAVPRQSGLPTKPVGRLTPVDPTTENTPAPQQGANGIPAVLTRQQYLATVNAMGKEATDQWIARNNVRIGQ